MGGGDAVARPPRDTFQNRFSHVLLGGGRFKKTIVVLLLLLLLRIMKDPVKIEIAIVIKATKSAKKMGHLRENTYFYSRSPADFLQI